MPCEIYEQRPLMCRKFDAGSDKCHALRRIYGYEPFLSAQEMFEAQQRLDEKEAQTPRSEKIRDVHIVRQTETGKLEIIGEMQDGFNQTIHTFDPNFETWREYQFRGLTPSDARQLIESQNDLAKTK